jgi:hypothetical protein
MRPAPPVAASVRVLRMAAWTVRQRGLAVAVVAGALFLLLLSLHGSSPHTTDAPATTLLEPAAASTLAPHVCPTPPSTPHPDPPLSDDDWALLREAKAARAAAQLAVAFPTPSPTTPTAKDDKDAPRDQVFPPIDWHAHERTAAASAQCRAPRAANESDVWGTHWVVVTSINLPTTAIAKLARLPGWHVVVVGDRKTPAEWAHPNCVFLSLDAQRALGYRLGALVPVASYARKNIGYLYAVAHGANVIYETDDDNLLTDPRITLLAGSPTVQRLAAHPSVAKHRVANVYAHFGQPTVWPRGYPVDAIAEGAGPAYAAAAASAATPLVQQQPATTAAWVSGDAAAVLEPDGEVVIGIEQGLADGDPDVDALFRLTRKNIETPIDIAFAREAAPLALPAFTFSPFNSQNTVFHAPALWATLIPTTTTFRVCDIWRGYWAQRLLWEAGAHLLFRGPNVRQDRNAHRYYADMVEEWDLYRDAGRLVAMLHAWRPAADADHLFARIDALTIAMYRERFWEEGDVHLVRAWLQDLLDVCYVPPRPGAARAPPVPEFAAPLPPVPTSHPGASSLSPWWAGTTLLGCGNQCTMQARVPVWLGPDVVIFTLVPASPLAHRAARVLRHTWGRHVAHLVVYTPATAAATLAPAGGLTMLAHPDPAAAVAEVPGTGGGADTVPDWLLGEALVHLIEQTPSASLYVYVDATTVPLLPHMAAWLDAYRVAHEGAVPYYVYDGAAGVPAGAPPLVALSRPLLEAVHACAGLRPAALTQCAPVAAELAARTELGFARASTPATTDMHALVLPWNHPNATFCYPGAAADAAAAAAAYAALYPEVPKDPIVDRLAQGWDG